MDKFTGLYRNAGEGRRRLKRHNTRKTDIMLMLSGITLVLIYLLYLLHGAESFLRS